jgi:hypothetical protein
MALAAQTGYEAGFALGNRAAVPDDPVFALPRWLMVDAVGPDRLQRLLAQAHGDLS